MQCNIDAKGKAIRLGYGVVMLIVGVALMIFWAHTYWSWAISIAIAVGGAFAIFEARAGWCIVRAMGWKTPL
jgi:hypothetical protein